MTLTATALSYSYPGTSRGITNASLAAAEGAVTALIGPSGAGKSTILACLAGALTPDSGQIEVTGERSTDQRSNRALITQNSSLFENLVVWENVALARGVPTRDRRRFARDVLSALDMHDLADVSPSSLSMGQRQRAAIAAVVAQNAHVVLADEPTGSLDAENTARVLAALRSHARNGNIVLIATHDPLVVSDADAIVDLQPQGGRK